MRIARVFPRKTSYTPDDGDAYVGLPTMFVPEYDEIHISVTFTWDVPEVELLAREWSKYGPIKIGGPAWLTPAEAFTPGLYLKKGVTITSRGCPNSCSWCPVPQREGPIRELRIHPGNIIQDNNLLACSQQHLGNVFAMLRSQRNIDFRGGLEASRISYWVVDQLRRLSIKQLWLSYDRPANIIPLRTATDKLRGHFTRDQLRCYVLIGYKGDTPEKALARLRQAWELGLLPHAQRYRTPEPDRNESFLQDGQEWKDLAAKWCQARIIKAMMNKKECTHGKERKRNTETGSGGRGRRADGPH
jgi:hypothetical protein